ncbi:MATE family efflux transporter [Sphingomonas qilianensis]|uniref:Multidrug-efflux transporter n=1 Tax=Sphingomonas qilianensis TaxID=1736690 RepID=A0ABU9XMH1_9SPHN
MRDLTTGPISKHLIGMAAFIGVGLVVQTLYFLVDLYFVAQLGKAAIAGVSSAGSTTFLVMAASQMVAVGALSLISQAIGRRDAADAQGVFEQSLSLSVVLGLATLVIGYTVGLVGVRALGADAATSALAAQYLAAYLPALALMFPVAAIGSALRASGVAGPPMLIQSLTVAFNALLAPVLVTGWLIGYPLGVFGAGLASSIATLAGSIAFVLLFGRMQPHLRLDVRRLAPRLTIWRRIADVGLPAAGEFVMIFVMTAVVYWIIRGYGPQVQAGYGIASRILQSIFLPPMAIAFAAAAMAGQNYGAKLPDRVRSTFYQCAGIGSIVMLVLTLLCQTNPQALILPFTHDPSVVAVAADYLRISSLNFVAIGLVFACSGMFQAFGDTRPALISSAGRLLTFVLPALYMSTRGDVALEAYWYLSAVAVTGQAIVSIWLLRGHMRDKLGNGPVPLVATAV